MKTRIVEGDIPHKVHRHRQTTSHVLLFSELQLFQQVLLYQDFLSCLDVFDIGSSSKRENNFVEYYLRHPKPTLKVHTEVHGFVIKILKKKSLTVIENRLALFLDRMARFDFLSF